MELLTAFSAHSSASSWEYCDILETYFNLAALYAQQLPGVDKNITIDVYLHKLIVHVKSEIVCSCPYLMELLCKYIYRMPIVTL